MSRTSRNTLKIETIQTNNTNSIHDPTPTDDTRKSYDVNSIWINTKTNNVFVCTNNSRNQAIWQRLTSQNDVENLESRILFLETVIFNLTNLKLSVNQTLD